LEFYHFNFFEPVKKAGLYFTPDYRKTGKLFNRWSVLWAIILSLVWSCSDAEPPASVSTGQGGNLRLVIKWPGDDMASKQDLELRDKVEQHIVKKQIGKIVRSGTGMGWMDILVKVNDQNRARPEIEAIVNAMAPDANFTIQAE